ncbi:MAG TPA: 2OG-Fe(II) oxygenase [Alphaproteobacteria bacterium]|nr:2OG-Fe(II) oxygenase [Alphaproteobacteria bacterium]
MFHYPIPPRPAVQKRTPPYVWGHGLFTEPELDKINAYAEKIPAKQVQVGMPLAYKPNLNRSILRHLMPNADTMWIYQKISMMVSLLNSQHYKYDITGFDEPLYHVTYQANDQGHYDWHTDKNGDGMPTRKLSITFQMSDPASYDGGDLEINAYGSIDKCPRERGKLILFPSYELHRVTPVTRGTRSALVAWSVGPAFR